jgi:AcrR family transcriptional regulator
MKTQKQDRRSERTRRLLSEALFSLMLERRYADLTVQDILDRANVGRSTFYAHYWDKDDLLTSQIEGIIEALSRQVGAALGDGTTLLPSLGLFQHVYEQTRLYPALVRGHAIELFQRALRVLLSKRVERQLCGMLPASATEMARTMAAQAVVGTFLALLQWWVENEMPLPPEEMDAYFRQLVLPGVQQMCSLSS